MRFLLLPLLSISVLSTSFIVAAQNNKYQNSRSSEPTEELRKGYEELIIAHRAGEAAQAAKPAIPELHTPNLADSAVVTVLGWKDGEVVEVPIPSTITLSGVPFGRTQAECDHRSFLTSDEESETELRREPASPDRPYLIAAVDRREDGCPVMVMMGTNEVRPLPTLSTDAPTVIPADARK